LVSALRGVGARPCTGVTLAFGRTSRIACGLDGVAALLFCFCKHAVLT